MFMTKLKIVAAAVLTVGIFGSATGWVLQSGSSDSVAWVEQPAAKENEKKVLVETKGNEKAQPQEAQTRREAAPQQLHLQQLRLQQEQIAVMQRQLAELLAQNETLQLHETMQRKNAEQASLKALTETKIDSTISRTYDARPVQVPNDATQNFEMILKQATEKQTEAEQRLQRAKICYENQAGTKLDVDSARINVETAKSEVARAKVWLAQSQPKPRPGISPSVSFTAEQPPSIPPETIVLETDVRQREADLKVAERELHFRVKNASRMKTLHDSGATDQQVLELAELESRKAQAEVERLRILLETARTMLRRHSNEKPAPPLGETKPSNTRLAELEAALESARQLKEKGYLAQSEWEDAQLALAEARMVEELNRIVELRQRVVNRAKPLFDAKIVTESNYKKTIDALEAAKRTQAEWKKH